MGNVQSFGVSKKLNASLVFSNPVNEILHLGMHAFADTFLTIQDLNKSEHIFPLNVVLDKKSGLIHNQFVTRAEDRYNLVDYSYTSSNSHTAMEHWKTFVPLLNDFGGKVGDKVIEVGSNDGYLCSLLSEEGYIVSAVDAAESMCKLSAARGITSHHKIFGLEASEEIKQLTGEIEFLIANNVFNHANDPLDFLAGIRNILSTDGFFILEVPYWYHQIENNRFDMIYHEHLSYFTVFSLRNLFELVDLHIQSVQVVDTHGGSLRVVGGKKKAFNNAVEKMISDEISSGIFTEDYYERARERIKRIKFDFMANIYTNFSGKEIFGIGAAAKANTFLTYFGLDSTILRAITDTSPHKIGKYTPLTRVPIVEDQALSEFEDPVAIVLSWNMQERIRQSLLKINPRIRYLDV